MRQTTLEHVEARQTSLYECEHHPCVIVQPVTPSSLRTGGGVPVIKTDHHYTKDGEGIFILWNEDCVSVHSEDPANSETIRKTRMAAAPRRPPNSKVGFYPEGIRGSGYFPIEEDCCVSTFGGESYIFRRNGGVQGPYPSRIPPHLPSSLIQPPTNPSNTSHDELQHHFDVQNLGLNNHINHCTTNVTTVDPRCLHSDAINGEPAYSQNTQDRFIAGNSITSPYDDDRLRNPYSVFDNFVNHQSANSQLSGHFNDGPGRGPRWQGIIQELDK
jgi:hypothetical protein